MCVTRQIGSSSSLSIAHMQLFSAEMASSTPIVVAAEEHLDRVMCKMCALLTLLKTLTRSTHLQACAIMPIQYLYTNKDLYEFFKKAEDDFNIDPKNTSFFGIVPHWPNSDWWHFTRHYRVIKVYPKGSLIVTCPAAGVMNDISQLKPAGDVGGPDRVTSCIASEVMRFRRRQNSRCFLQARHVPSEVYRSNQARGLTN
jgi:hypothetical protein